MSISVTRIEIDVHGKKLSLTPDQSRKLYEELRKFFGSPAPIRPTVPWLPPRPVPWWSGPHRLQEDNGSHRWEIDTPEGPHATHKITL